MHERPDENICPLSMQSPRAGAESGPDDGRTRLVRLVLEHALERSPPLFASLRSLALSLDRRLLVVLAPLHLLKEAVLEHLLLELLQSGVDLIVEDNDLHSGHPEMPRRAMRTERDRIVDDVHLAEPLGSMLDRTGDCRESLARLLDDLTCVVDNAPAPASLILRG